MAYSVVRGTFEGLQHTWKESLSRSATNSIFLTPRWQQIWWDHFGSKSEVLLLEVRHDGQPVGVAPLLLQGDKMTFIGNTEVCDFLDFVLPPEHAPGALDAVLQHIENLPWRTLCFTSVPAASPTLSYMRGLGALPGYEALIEEEDVAPFTELPKDWESYLGLLSKKDRHELRRKFRRLEKVGNVRFVTSAESNDLERDMSTFLTLHRESREDKAAFMTAEKEAFFRDIVGAFAPKGVAKFSFLEVDGVRTAAILYFDYNNERLLYNSGFDQEYGHLSVGLLLKARALGEAIEAGYRRFDFLRGNEPYKYDLGAVDAQLYRCVITRND